MTIALTPALLRGRLARLVEEEKRRAESRPVDSRAPVAVRFPGRWTGGETIEAGGVTFAVRVAESVLAFRAALHDRPADARLVLVTPLEAREVGLDAQVRLAGRQLLDVEPWKVVLGLFGALSFDPRLREPALAEALLESCPPEGYPAVPSGILDEDTAWQALARARLGLADVSDPAALVGWALVDGQRYVETPIELRVRLRAYFERRLAPTAGLVFSVLDGAQPARIGVALLMCHLVERVRPFDASTAGQLPFLVAAMDAGQVRDPATSAAVTRAIEGAYHTCSEVLAATAEALDRLVEQAGLGSALVYSELSPLGLRMRQAALADALDGGDAIATWRALERYASHRLAGRERQEPAHMLARLHAWSLVGGESTARDLGRLSAAYVEQLAWVDRARQMVAAADLGQELSRAARRLIDRVRQRREAFNRHFAETLAGWLSGPVPLTSVVPAERIIDEVLAPVAARGNALLLLLDGMSQPLAQVVVGQLEGRGWLVSTPPRPSPERAPPLAGLAPVPTVTQMSRSSLIAGRLMAGGQHDEQRAFVEHSALRRHCQSERPPVLMHQAQFEQATLAESLGKISDRRRRVVGVIINAIDDELSGSRQYDRTWSIDHIIPLRSVLDAAREAERAVVVVSDHGHVWDDGTRYRQAGGEAERWRRGDVAEEGECLIRGPRVEAVTGAPTAIALWTEQERYTRNRHAGYHGGLTPQEVLTPLFVLWPGARADEADDTAPVALPPAWWSRGGAEPSAERSPPPPPLRAPAAPPSAVVPSPPTGQLTFFASSAAPHDPAPRTLAPSPTSAVSSWGAMLIASEIYEVEVGRMSRAPKPEQVQRLIDALVEMGGRGARERVAVAIGMLPNRVPNLVSAVSRVLNFDGYAILSHDIAEDAVRLDLDLMRRQFQLGKGR